jgi:hypothetical protein
MTRTDDVDLMPSKATPSNGMSSNMATRWLLAVASTAIWSYLIAVLFSGGRIAGVRFSGAVFLVLVAVGGAALAWWSGWLSEPRRRDVLASCLSILVAVLAIDTAYTVWINVRTERRTEQADERLNDAHVWHGELFPRSYYPSDRAFTLYKPNVRVEGLTYGEFYERRMLESPTLVRDALHLRPLVYTIDANGLRNRVPILQSKLWALGDSYAMGYSTTEGLTWTDRLGELTGHPVYNIGVSGTSPGVQVQVLEHLLRKGKDGARPEHLLWMVFEGNDLENSYAERRSLPQARRGFRTLLDDTIIGDILSLPSTIRRRSVLGRLLGGEFRAAPPRAASQQDPYRIDGVPVATPVYRSERWGYCMFNPVHMEAAAQGEDYVLSHPNRPRLERAFDRMKSLADEFGFRVTVMVAPSAPRALARDFPDMPQPTPIPHFIRHVEGLAKRSSFEWIDLLGSLAADHSGMLYYCDDHHWNERGNDVVARILAGRL